MEDIDDEIEIISRPTKSKPRPTNDEPRNMKPSEKAKKANRKPSPLQEIKAISVIGRREYSAIGSPIDEHIIA